MRWEERPRVTELRVHKSKRRAITRNHRQNVVSRHPCDCCAAFLTPVSRSPRRDLGGAEHLHGRAGRHQSFVCRQRQQGPATGMRAGWVDESAARRSANPGSRVDNQVIAQPARRIAGRSVLVRHATRVPPAGLRRRRREGSLCRWTPAGARHYGFRRPPPPPATTAAGFGSPDDRRVAAAG